MYIKSLWTPNPTTFNTSPMCFAYPETHPKSILPLQPRTRISYLILLRRENEHQLLMQSAIVSDLYNLLLLFLLPPYIDYITVILAHRLCYQGLLFESKYPVTIVTVSSLDLDCSCYALRSLCNILFIYSSERRPRYPISSHYHPCFSYFSVSQMPTPSPHVRPV
jgi:hypothetical protein